MNERVYGLSFHISDALGKPRRRIERYGSRLAATWPMFALIVNKNTLICCLRAAPNASPIYTYDEDGSNRRENITDLGAWTASAPTTETTRSPSGTSSTTFMASSTTPVYRDRYQANLKRDLPRIPFAPEFPGVRRGGRAAWRQIHVGYEEQPEYRLSPGRNAGNAA